MKINIIIDGYERKARLFPALLLIAPVVVTAVAMLSAKLSCLQTFGAALAGCGGAFLLAQLARDAGKMGEKILFEKWGGLPSISILRHRDTRLDPITKTRYHKMLSLLVKEAKAPTAKQEEVDPAFADSVYAAWSNFLRVNTRDTKKFALLFQENVSYGYRRNVWGLKSYGIIVSLVSLAACGVRFYLTQQSKGNIDEWLLGASVLDVVFLLLWIFRFTGEWVRVPAEAYAERLVECTETLAVKASAAKAIRKAPNQKS